MSVFGKNNSCHLSIFLQTHTFWKFDISRTYNQINYKNIWFAKVIMILIMMAQVLLFDVFFEKGLHHNAVEFSLIPGPFQIKYQCTLLKYLLHTSEISTELFWRTKLHTSGIITLPFSSIHYTWPTAFIINDIYFSGKSNHTKCCLDYICCQPGDSWHSKGLRKHNEKRKLLQNQLSECGSIILCSVALFALIV